MQNKNYGKVLGELESEIMEIIWQTQHPLSVAEVVKIISKKRTIAHTTVMTIMGRLVEKGLLTRNLSGSSYLYQPKVNREKFVARAVHSIFTSTLSTLGQEAVTYFVKEIQKMNPKKRRDLLKMLD